MYEEAKKRRDRTHEAALQGQRVGELTAQQRTAHRQQVEARRKQLNRKLVCLSLSPAPLPGPGGNAARAPHGGWLCLRKRAGLVLGTDSPRRRVRASEIAISVAISTRFRLRPE